jgi:hypothetical protein
MYVFVDVFFHLVHGACAIALNSSLLKSLNLFYYRQVLCVVHEILNDLYLFKCVICDQVGTFEAACVTQPHYS